MGSDDLWNLESSATGGCGFATNVGGAPLSTLVAAFGPPLADQGSVGQAVLYRADRRCGTWRRLGKQPEAGFQLIEDVLRSLRVGPEAKSEGRLPL